MNILLVNNITYHLEKFYRLLPEADLIIVKPYELSRVSINNYRAAILTGSYTKSVFNNGDYYADELRLIREAPIPVIGICLGLQLIVHAYGGTILKLPQRIHGNHIIKAVKDNDMFGSRTSFKVYEGHSWAVSELPAGLDGYAKSQSGWEIAGNEEKKIYGLQFHPEVDSAGADGRELFLHIFNTVLK